MDKHYLVDLTITIGGFEKASQTLVFAPSESTAKTLAIALEAHNHECFKWGDNDKTSGTDMDFHYAAVTIQPITNDDFAVLNKYQQLFKYEDYTSLINSIPERWELLMSDDPSMLEHIARYETGDATSEDYLLLAIDTLINGNMKETVDYIAQSIGDDGSLSDISSIVMRVTEDAGHESVNSLTGDLIEEVNDLIQSKQSKVTEPEPG